jgi:hypothetical protein
MLLLPMEDESYGKIADGGVACVARCLPPKSVPPHSPASRRSVGSIKDIVNRSLEDVRIDWFGPVTRLQSKIMQRTKAGQNVPEEFTADLGWECDFGA